MKNVANVETILRANPQDVREGLRELRARNNAVQHVIARRQPPERPNSVFSPLPQQIPLMIIPRPSHAARPAPHAHLHNRSLLLFHRLAQPLHLQQQYCRAVPRKSCLDVVFHDARGITPAACDASSIVSKVPSSVFTASGLRESFTVISVISARVPSLPTKSPQRS